MLSRTTCQCARAVSRCLASPAAPIRMLSSTSASHVAAARRLAARQGASQLLPASRQQQSLPWPRGFAAAAAAGDAPSSAPSLVERLKSDMKEAMKAKDQARLGAIRFLSAAIKTREIELREAGGVVTEEEAIKVIQKMVKQRKDSIDSYKAGGREDLVEKEQVELVLLESYLPAQLSTEEVEAVVVQVIAELGLSGPKAMGAVMKAVTARTGGRTDSKTISDLAKAKLTGK